MDLILKHRAQQVQVTIEEKACAEPAILFDTSENCALIVNSLIPVESALITLA